MCAISQKYSEHIPRSLVRLTLAVLPTKRIALLPCFAYIPYAPKIKHSATATTTPINAPIGA